MSKATEKSKRMRTEKRILDLALKRLLVPLEGTSNAQYGKWIKGKI